MAWNTYFVQIRDPGSVLIDSLLGSECQPTAFRANPEITGNSGGLFTLVWTTIRYPVWRGLTAKRPAGAWPWRVPETSQLDYSSSQPIADPDASLEITHVAFLVDGDKFSDVLTTIRAQEIAITERPEDTEITFSFFIKDLDGKSF